jgi:hypothetical protein
MLNSTGLRHRRDRPGPAWARIVDQDQPIRQRRKTGMSIQRLFPTLVLLAAAANAQAHARLQSSEPKAASTVQAPRALRLQFNEALEPAFSKLALLDSANAPVAIEHVEVDKANPKLLTAALPALRPGQYRVQWSTVTHDGHRTKGEFGFRVK